MKEYEAWIDMQGTALHGAKVVVLRRYGNATGRFVLLRLKEARGHYGREALLRLPAHRIAGSAPRATGEDQGHG